MKLKTIVVGGEHLTPQQEKLRKIFDLILPVSVFGNDIHLKYAVDKVACWVIAVLVAYFLNRITVFRSKGKILGELLKFAGARVLSFLLFELGLFTLSLYLCEKATGVGSDTVVTSFLGIPIKYADIMNLINLIFVMIANYVFSKLMVFRKEDMIDYTKTDKESEAEDTSVEEGAENA